MFKSKDARPKSTAVSKQTPQVVAALLAEFGRNAFDCQGRSANQLDARCQAWIDHLLNGEAPPTDAEWKPGWIDWPGLREFFAEERERERAHVDRSIEDLRELVLTVLQNFSQTVTAEQESSDILKDRLQSLRSSANSECSENLKGVVLGVVDELNDFLSGRDTAMQERLEILGKQVTELESELTHVRRTAERDGLTKVYNRQSLDDHLLHVRDTSRRTEDPYVLMMIDVDHFKKFNDDHGHQFGDQVLVEVAAALGTVFVRDGDFIARYGGEEFSIVARCKIDDARRLAERLLQALRDLKLTKSDGTVVGITASAGLAALESTDTVETWIERADNALYASKHLGRDRLTIASH